MATPPKLLRFCLLCCIFISFTSLQAQTGNRDIYELKIYHLENSQQVEVIDSFLEAAYIPAVHKLGVKKVGVFKPVAGDSLFGKRIYVLTPFSSAEQVVSTPRSLLKDKEYIAEGDAFLNAPHDAAPYERIESIVMQAFEGMPQFRETRLYNPTEDRIYELRSYESATEKLFFNKVKMFNEGEVEIFTDLGFNPIFFGEVIAGSNAPNLMYMTTFKDKTSRDEHWKAFGEYPQWKAMAADEYYKNNVSHIDAFFLQPTSYSEL